MIKKLFGLTAIVMMTAVGSAGVAAAQDAYPPADDSATASDSTPAPGQEITVSAQTFLPGSDVTFSLGAEVLGVVVTNDQGVASITFDAPTAEGTYTVSASGTGADGEPLTVTTTITVAAAGAAAGSGDLPTTGSDSSIPMTQVALAAIVGGGLLVLIANKRRSATPERETAGV